MHYTNTFVWYDIFTLPERGMEYFLKYSGNARICYFDLLEMAWHQPQTIKYCYFYATLACSVIGEKCRICNVWYTVDCTGMYLFYTSPKIPHNFQGIHHYIVNLWAVCVHSIVRYWHHANFWTDRWIRIWVQQQNGRKGVWLKVHLVILVS